MVSFIRPPTEAEKRDFQLVTEFEPGAEFKVLLGKENQKAITQGLPFARKAALDDYEDYIDDWKKKILRQHGFFPAGAKAPQPEIDWEQYSNLKNFEIEDVKQVENPPSKSGHIPGRTYYVVKFAYKEGNCTSTVFYNTEEDRERILSLHAKAHSTKVDKPIKEKSED